MLIKSCLADRDTLADQVFDDFTGFAAFEDNALARLEPDPQAPARTSTQLCDPPPASHAMAPELVITPPNPTP
ncbi:MAG: hypothetical protein ACKO3F_02515 [Cyanobium sp.]